MLSLSWLWISIVSRHQHLCVVHTGRFKVSGAWGRVGTWRSVGRCGDPGRACRPSPGLWRMTSLSVFLFLQKPPKQNKNHSCSSPDKTYFLPMPPPPCGGAPYRKESMYALIFSRSVQQTNRGSKFSSVVPLVANRGRQIIWISLNAPQKETETSLFLTNLMVDGSFCQQLSIVDSLSSGENLFSSHEHVIRVGVFLDKNKTNSEIRFFSHLMMNGGVKKKEKEGKLKSTRQGNTGTKLG